MHLIKKNFVSQPHLRAHATFSLVDLNIQANVPKDWEINQKKLVKDFIQNFDIYGHIWVKKLVVFLYIVLFGHYTSF